MNIKQETVMCCDNCHRVYVIEIERNLGCEYMADMYCETCGKHIYKKVMPGKLEKILFCSFIPDKILIKYVTDIMCCVLFLLILLFIFVS